MHVKHMHSAAYCWQRFNERLLTFFIFVTFYVFTFITFLFSLTFLYIYGIMNRSFVFIGACSKALLPP